EEAMVGLAPSEELMLALERARAAAAQTRAEFAEARAAAQNLEREAEARIARRAAISAERKSWDERRARAEAQISEIAERRAGADEERERLADAPHEFGRRRRALADEFDTAEAARKEASDARALGETALAEAGRARRDELLRVIQAELDCEPSGLAALAKHEPNAPLPELDRVMRKLESLEQERERLGAVNLRADEELAEVEASRDRLIAERDDLTEAIKRLRQAIGSLNQEGRERLVAAFDVVNGHFKSLFSTLFEGGEAELQLVESDDPLEAGLELLARPPGKKPQTLTLLSGGEQALTALSLIFAVFLTNPSPICVLDEVDAPLDDYNV